MIDTIEQAACKNCGRPIPQSRGPRKREYCDNSKCKQAVYRQRKEQQAKELVAKLKRENEELKVRLNVEERYRIDTRKRHFKSWLQSHPQPSDTTFFRRFLDDRDIPTQASRAMYEARLHLHKERYSDEDILLFQDAWKNMLFGQK